MRAMRFFVLVLLCFSATVLGQTDSREIVIQLSRIRLDPQQFYSIRDITIRRDALSIFFNRGTIAFLQPVMGKVTGAVFIGTGEVVAIPSDPVEKQQLYRFTGSPLLNEPFRSAFLQFTDNTYEEVLKAHAEHAQEEVTADDRAAFAPWDDLIGDRLRKPVDRILADLLSGDDSPIFMAELNGERVGWFNVVYDQQLAEEIVVAKVHDEPETSALDVWASFQKRGDARSPEQDAARIVMDIVRYNINATLSADAGMQASADVSFRVLKDNKRVFTFDLSRFLKVSAVTLNGGEAAAFYQNHSLTNEEVQRSGTNTVTVVLPQPLRAGQEIGLRFTYSGDVIDRRGTGIFYVGDRGLWYPNAGRQDRALFDLTFHFPERYSLVATGRKVREWQEDGLRHSNWTSGVEFPVAGFNLGDFTILTDETGPVPISVGVNNDVEPIFKEVAARRAYQQELTLRSAVRPAPIRRGMVVPSFDSILVSPDYSIFSTRTLAENILQEVRSTVQYFSETFGPYPYPGLIVSQFPVGFSQGWPSLVYLSTLSFFNPAQRAQLGLNSEDDFRFTELVRAHEIAHQWFGNNVGWKSYRDQWISEAFANYAGAMYLEKKYAGMPRMRQILDNARESLVSETGSGEMYDSIGPVSLGSRLSTANIPDGYTEIVYNKGTWILHMLRMLMRGDGADPDAAYVAMVRDFITTYNGREPSTQDFKRIAEKHMTKDMDLTGEGNLDWFFDQWVYGTGIPRYSLQYTIEGSGNAFVVAGRIVQRDVSEEFLMPVPVFGDDRLLGVVIAGSEESTFRYTTSVRPARIVLDPNGTILARFDN
jgi:hypothetical protein